jgi:hypothetical protein
LTSIASTQDKKQHVLACDAVKFWCSDARPCGLLHNGQTDSFDGMNGIHGDSSLRRRAIITAALGGTTASVLGRPEV